MSDSDNDPLSGLLSSFALGPSWARATGSGQQERASKPSFKSDERPPRRDDRKGDFRDKQSGGRPFDERRGKFNDRREAPPRNEEAPPAIGVRVTLAPDAHAVHLIGKEIHQVARAYPLYDVAKILLAERSRCLAVFEANESHPPLFRGRLDDSVFLTKEEAVLHLWNSELKNQLIEEETIEVDPPKGNFQLVARCGLSGEWLGPPNFHAYQINLRRLHRERFPSMPFTAYSAKVRTERGEEAVNAWLETMKTKVRWRIKGDGNEAWLDDPNEVQRALATRCLDKAFAEVRTTEMLASVPPQNLSPSLLTSLKIAGNHARNHPAILIPAVCRAIEAEHLPVFKRLGKLFTGPARPHPLALDAVLAERPGIMVNWIRANKPAKLEGLWQAVLPEGGTAPPAEFAADLFWLLHQGHILLFTDDTLVVQDLRDPQSTEPSGDPKPKKKKKKKSKKPAAEGAILSNETPSAETPAESAPVEASPGSVANETIPEPPPEPEVTSAPETPITEAPTADESGFSTDSVNDDELSKIPLAEVDDAPAL
ncbi:MAG: hypothetical protein H8M99_06540 [Gloeobacteraceae cyanobacterium ES-bin-144]|nr:hypothetical protein [Verrucomicrobiales bacterium]